MIIIINKVGYGVEFGVAVYLFHLRLEFGGYNSASIASITLSPPCQNSGSSRLTLKGFNNSYGEELPPAFNNSIYLGTNDVPSVLYRL